MTFIIVVSYTVLHEENDMLFQKNKSSFFMWGQKMIVPKNLILVLGLKITPEASFWTIFKHRSVFFWSSEDTKRQPNRVIYGRIAS